MTQAAANGPFLLCYDGSESARDAIHAAAALLGGGRASTVLYIYKPTEGSLGVIQALTGNSIDAPVLGETDAQETLERGVKVAREAGFEVTPKLVAAERGTAEIITMTADELDSPAIVMGQRGRTGLKAAILGSVSRDVLSSNHRPVILV